MEISLSGVLAPGLALAGVLAVAGAWSRAASSPGGLPHLGVGALAGAAVLAGFRLGALPVWLLLPIIAVGAAVVAVGTQLLDRAVRARTSRLAGMPDVAVLAALVALAALLQPLTAIPLPFGPLGAQPGPLSAAAAAVVGAAGVAVVVSAWGRLVPAARWAAFGAVLGVTAVLAGGVLGSGLFPGTALLALPDTAGLAVRGAAAAVLGRRGITEAATAGAGIGLLEGLIRAAGPFGGWALLPAVIAGLAGALGWRSQLVHQASADAR